MNQSIFLFEWYSGGGCHVDGIDPKFDRALINEGLSMIVQLANELAACDDLTVNVPVDNRIDASIFDEDVNVIEISMGQSTDSRAKQLLRLIRNSISPHDLVLYIAPESAGRLRTVATWFDKIEYYRLLCPGVELVEICESKQKTVELLASRRIPVPNGCLVKNFDAATHSFQFPLIVKPDDGAGSDDVRFIHNQREIDELAGVGNYRVEEFVCGTPISVACLMGPNRRQLLPPTRQIFATQPFGKYIGFDYPVSSLVAARASALAGNVIDALPEGSVGYIGIDMVLGNGENHRDIVIEVNPRLTSSYCGLSHLCGGRLARALVDSAIGLQVAIEFPRKKFRYRIAQQQSFCASQNVRQK